MGAKLLKIDGGTQAKRESSRKFSHYAEDLKAQYLLTGTDARGRTVYFFTMQITGLRNRLFGPFDSRTLALTGFDTVLQAALESFCDVGNDCRGTDGMEHIAFPTDLKACR